MLSFIALLHGLGTAATELPRGEGWEEEDESSVDDPVQFRVVSADWEPIELERQ